MAYEQKPNSGTLWHQTEKKKETAPDFTGSVFFDRDYLLQVLEAGEILVEIKFSGWRKKISTQKGDRNVLNLNVDTYNKSAPAPKSTEKDPWDD